MAKKIKLSKEEVAAPDAFISTTDKFITWLEKNKKVLLVVLVLALGGALAKVGSESYQSTQMDQAENGLYVFKKQLMVKLEAIDKNQQDANKNLPKGTPAKKAIKTPETFDSKLRALVEPYSAEILKGSSAPSLQHAIYLADLYGEYGKNDQALVLLTAKAKSKAPGKDLLSSLVWVRLGTLLANKGSYEDAIIAFDKILKSKAPDFIHADVLLKKALCHEKLGQVEQAQATYKTITTKHTKSSEARSAATYLRLLQLKLPDGKTKG